MQTTIDAIRDAHAATMRAIHQANRDFGNSGGIAVMLHRLQEAGLELKAAENQAVRAKSRRDLLASHPTQTPEYWERLALDERAFAESDRLMRTGSVESIELHIKNAEQYEAKAKDLRAA
ncbi:hypothetical protein D8I35_05490 [Corticibacter populi]|uniref:Uncharacterized protein n=1 Tax=Corticibacter populi TaxID=1550736 RepID=A0A3M6QZU4_9BURK|nr:hypothetical protein [Corticibacter populi]RMX08530.1 hypothetical protein D8I35_05490 [Corticibacter populi]RZS35846.1 hypothetical protein EV687_0926 [Corticibacter populi]